MQDVVENNILRFWLDRMQDRENGGFYGRIDADEVLHKDAEKGAILNARILWSFSAAYRVLSGFAAEAPAYLEAATRAYEYFTHFIDPDYGGVYWSVDCKGNPLDTKKQFYAIGFAIYGLSEYARATGSREALDYAISLYECIEEHAFDREHNGYIEACTREWGEMTDMRLSELDANYPKSQNTHLHIIEPYTNLYRCIREMQARSVFTNRMVVPRLMAEQVSPTSSTPSASPFATGSDVHLNINTSPGCSILPVSVAVKLANALPVA